MDPEIPCIKCGFVDYDMSEDNKYIYFHCSVCKEKIWGILKEVENE